jgi:hypothetical protein
MFADDIFTKTRTLIGAKETGNAACNTSNHAANRRAEGARRVAALLRTASGAASNTLCLGSKRERKQPRHR